jgi:hypothetical protein
LPLTVASAKLDPEIMASVRGQLRFFVAAWLVFQAASLSALIPRDCCAAHRQTPPSERPPCAGERPAAQCPMRSASETSCPMHRGDQRETSSSAKCVLRGSCDGPMAGLFLLLSHHGVLANRAAMPLDLAVCESAGSPHENPATHLSAPDPHPPRA